MKKSFLIFTILVAVSATGVAQKRGKQERINVDFYGIDFTGVNVVGAKETNEKFILAFEQINRLLVSEPDKYNVAKYFGFNVVSTDINHAISRLESLRNKNFRDGAPQELRPDEIVAAYPATDNAGLIIIAKELNKSKNKGTFVAVIYDGQTKRIISENEFSGKSGGFGLRNFWAGSLYNGLQWSNHGRHIPRRNFAFRPE